MAAMLAVRFEALKADTEDQHVVLNISARD